LLQNLQYFRNIAIIFPLFFNVLQDIAAIFKIFCQNIAEVLQEN